MKQELMGWQCHQLDHMEIICTSLQTDNHTNTVTPHHSIFCGLDALPAPQLTMSKHHISGVILAMHHLLCAGLVVLAVAVPLRAL